MTRPLFALLAIAVCGNALADQARGNLGTVPMNFYYKEPVNGAWSYQFEFIPTKSGFITTVTIWGFDAYISSGGRGSRPAHIVNTITTLTVVDPSGTEACTLAPPAPSMVNWTCAAVLQTGVTYKVSVVGQETYNGFASSSPELYAPLEVVE